MNMATHAKTRRNILNFDISYKIISPVGGEQSLEAQLAVVLREVVKYYFADFVRKGGTPPLYGQNFRQKKGYGHSPEKCSSKSAKNGVFCPKNTCFWSKK